MVRHGEKLSRKKEDAIAALLTCKTVAEAAEVASIGQNTLFRWLRMEDFKTAYRNARKEVVAQAIAQIQNGLSDAVKTLTDIMKDNKAPASARVAAGKIMLDMAIRAIETEDLEARITKIERKFSNER